MRIRIMPLLLIGLLCTLFPAYLVPAEAVEAAPEASSTPMWLTALLGLIGTAITAYLAPWLTKYLKAKEASAKAEAGHADMSRKAILMQRLEEFLYNSAAHLAAKELPRIAALVSSGDITDGDAVKAELKSIGARLKDMAKTKFAAEGIDIVEEFGDDVIDDLIDRMAARVNFPGKDTVATLLKGGVADKLVDKGLSWVKRYLAKADGDPEAEGTSAVEKSDKLQ